MQVLRQFISLWHIFRSAASGGASLHHPEVPQEPGSCLIQIQSNTARKIHVNLAATPVGQVSTAVKKSEFDKPLTPEQGVNASLSHQNYSTDSFTVPRANSKSWDVSTWTSLLSLETARAVANQSLAKVVALMESVPLNGRYPFITEPSRSNNRVKESSQVSHGGALFMLGFALILMLSSVFACSVAVYVSAPVGEEPRITRDFFCCYPEDPDKVQNQMEADDPIDVFAPAAEVSTTVIDVQSLPPPSFVPPPSSIPPHISYLPHTSFRPFEDAGREQILQSQNQSYDPWYNVAAQPVFSADPTVQVDWGTSIEAVMTESPLK